ncbi:hypothetical protein D3C75_590920 [compost metagenome]
MHDQPLEAGVVAATPLGLQTIQPLDGVEAITTLRGGIELPTEIGEQRCRACLQPHSGLVQSELAGVEQQQAMLLVAGDQHQHLAGATQLALQAHRSRR